MKKMHRCRHLRLFKLRHAASINAQNLEILVILHYCKICITVSFAFLCPYS